jgi:hypothetical protein
MEEQSHLSMWHGSKVLGNRTYFNLTLEKKPVFFFFRKNFTSNIYREAQTALFKDPVHTAL